MNKDELLKDINKELLEIEKNPKRKTIKLKELIDLMQKSFPISTKELKKRNKALNYKRNKIITDVNLGLNKRYAICIHGLVGSNNSKSHESPDSSEEVLKLGFYHINKFILNINRPCDVFIHTWNTGLKELIINLYKPISIVSEPQIIFKFKTNKPDPKQKLPNIYSRWYSQQAANNLKKEYEDLHNIKYDVVMHTRFDLAIRKDIDFSKINFEQDQIYIGNDYFFIGQSNNMNQFSNLYNQLDRYSMHEEISYHRIISMYLNEIKVNHKEILNEYSTFREDDGFITKSESDFALIRDAYYNHNTHKMNKLILKIN